MSFCPQYIAPQTLNSLLIPSNLVNSTQAQVDAYLCVNFRSSLATQWVIFVLDLCLKAKKTSARPGPICSRQVNIAVRGFRRAPILTGKALKDYYDFFVTSRTGFAYIVHKVLQLRRTRRMMKKAIANGKWCCP